MTRLPLVMELLHFRYGISGCRRADPSIRRLSAVVVGVVVIILPIRGRRRGSFNVGGISAIVIILTVVVTVLVVVLNVTIFGGIP